MLKHFAIFLLMLILFFTVSLTFIIQPVFEQKRGTSKIQVDAKVLRNHVAELSQKMPGRSEDVDDLNKSAEYIKNVFSNYTDRAALQEFDVWGIPYNNVVAEFGSPNSSCGLYIIGAHYDSFDGYPGADDNASGVAGLLELARLFSKFQVPCQLVLVAFALEEPPNFRSEYMGSFAHARTLSEREQHVELMISLEMIGYFSDLSDSQSYPIEAVQYFYPRKANFISVVGNFGQSANTRFFKKEMLKATNIPVYSVNAPSFIPGIDFSDHLSYWHSL